MRAELDALKTTVQTANQANEELKLQFKELSSHMENVERHLWSDRLCNSTKNAFSGKISEFISQVQAGIPGVCTASNLETALIFMNNEPYVTAYFRPGDNMERLHLTRRGYLQNRLLEHRYLHSSTRLLLLVQPAEENEASRNQAMDLGKEFSELVRTKMLPAEKPPRVLGPHLLPCRLRTEIRRVYHGKLDDPLPTEPREGTPMIRIWLFRTDC